MGLSTLRNLRAKPLNSTIQFPACHDTTIDALSQSHAWLEPLARSIRGTTQPIARLASFGRADERVTDFLKRVYGWMFVGLALTAIATFVAGRPDLVQAIAGNMILFIALVVAELGLVWWISARVDSLAPSTAAGLFLLYSALNGVTLSLILLVYAGASIASAFFTTAAMFGALARYGSMTKRSLARIGQFRVHGTRRHYHRLDRRTLLEEQCTAIRHLGGRRHRVHGPHCPRFSMLVNQVYTSFVPSGKCF